MVQAETNSRVNSDNFDIDNGDDELKNIIDELNEAKSQAKSENAGNKKTNDRSYTTQDACEVLGVSENASLEEIKSAYKKKIIGYHPDKVAHLGEELQKMAEIKTKDINHAYNYLKKVKNNK